MSDSINAPAFRDPEFRLKASDRHRLDHAFNADVVEELLARYESIDRRTAALGALLELADLVARGEATITGMSTSDEHPAVDESVRKTGQTTVIAQFLRPCRSMHSQARIKRVHDGRQNRGGFLLRALTSSS